MENISTDLSEKLDIKHGQLSESPLRGSTARYICNPIIDDIEADPKPSNQSRRNRVNRVVIDTTLRDGDNYQYEPPSCHVIGDPSVNDLATYRWHRSGLDAATEAQLIQRIQGGANFIGPLKPHPGHDHERAFRQLLEAFHRTVVGPAGDFIPGRMFYRRQPKGQKHPNDLLYEDLTSEGCFALWQSAVKFDLDRGHRFSTLSRHKIVGAISNEANYLRQGGYTSGDTVGRYLRKEVGRRTQSRLDRWIFDNLGATPEELLKEQDGRLGRDKTFHSLEEAASALKQANSLQHSDVYSDGGDDRDDISRNSDDDAHTGPTEPLEEFRDAYQSQDPLYWSPQLAVHRNKVSPIVDFWIRELCDPPRIKPKPNPKPVYRPSTVKPSGRVLHPHDKPYWMQPRDERPTEKAGKSYDPDRRESGVIRFRNGKTKRVYRQKAASPVRHIAIVQARRKSNVRANREQTSGRASANVVVLESRRSRPQRFHVCQQCNPPSIGDRFARTGIAG